MLPLLSGNNEMESIIDLDTTMATPLTSELVEKIVDEFLALKNSMNTVELQLYEANEKIAELIENVSKKRIIMYRILLINKYIHTIYTHIYVQLLTEIFCVYIFT